VWASASSRCGYLLSAAAWGRLLSELHRLKTFPPVELRGAREAQRNRTNLCPAPVCRRRSPRNSQFLCRHNTDSLQSSAGYFRRLAVCFFVFWPVFTQLWEPRGGDRFRDG
jgi:hypothetical protein